MKRFVTGQAGGQVTLFPQRLEDFIAEDNPVRVIDVFVEELDLLELGFTRVDALATGRPAYHPAVLLKLYIYSYLNRGQSSRLTSHQPLRGTAVDDPPDAPTPHRGISANTPQPRYSRV